MKIELTESMLKDVEAIREFYKAIKGFEGTLIDEQIAQNVIAHCLQRQMKDIDDFTQWWESH